MRTTPKGLSCQIDFIPTRTVATPWSCPRCRAAFLMGNRSKPLRETPARRSNCTWRTSRLT